jgi:hypothetical protein
MTILVHELIIVHMDSKCLSRLELGKRHYLPGYIIGYSFHCTHNEVAKLSEYQFVSKYDFQMSKKIS